MSNRCQSLESLSLFETVRPFRFPAHNSLLYFSSPPFYFRFCISSLFFLFLYYIFVAFVLSYHTTTTTRRTTFLNIILSFPGACSPRNVKAILYVNHPFSPPFCCFLFPSTNSSHFPPRSLLGGHRRTFQEETKGLTTNSIYPQVFCMTEKICVLSRDYVPCR